MDTKLNLYDFLAYIIPGAIFAILLYWFFIAFLAFPSPTIASTSDAVSLLLLLAVSYFLGHLVQAAGARHQKQTEKKNGWLSEKYLQDDNNRYTSEYKKNLKEYMEQLFGLAPDAATLDQEVQKRRQQEIFYLCNVVVRQEIAANNPETLRSVCALYRSIFIVMWVGVLFGVLIATKQFFLWFFLQVDHSLLPRESFFTFNGVQLTLGIIVAAFSFWTTKWLKSRWNQYTEYYVDSVYSNFYAWYRRKYLQQPTNIPSKENEPERQNVPL